MALPGNEEAQRRLASVLFEMGINPMKRMSRVQASKIDVSVFLKPRKSDPPTQYSQLRNWS